jgi:hypothetical protein
VSHGRSLLGGPTIPVIGASSSTVGIPSIDININVDVDDADPWYPVTVTRIDVDG